MRSTQTKVTAANLAQWFSACLPIYSKWHILTSCCEYRQSPHNIANAISANIAPYSITLSIVTIPPQSCEPIPLHNRQRSMPTIRNPASQWQAMPMTSERSTPANERSYITSQSGQDHDRSISPATQTASEQSSLTHGNSSAAWPPGTPRNLFLYGAADRLPHQPTHPKLARLQNPDTPLYLEKPVIWPLYQCQY